MHLAQDNDVVHTLTPDRSDQPFGKAVLPGRSWCGRLVPDAVCTENLNPDVVVMKFAKNGVPFDASGPLNQTNGRRIFVQRSVRSNAVVIISVGFQNSAQMRLAQDNNVVQTLAPDRSDQPFGEAILPG
jgi:hypothetical protein